MTVTKVSLPVQWPSKEEITYWIIKLNRKIKKEKYPDRLEKLRGIKRDYQKIKKHINEFL